MSKLEWYGMMVRLCETSYSRAVYSSDLKKVYTRGCSHTGMQYRGIRKLARVMNLLFGTGGADV